MNVFHHNGSLSHLSPVYVDRKKQLKRISGWIETGDLRYILVFGAPRTGKSSLIHHLRYHLAALDIPLYPIDIGLHRDDFYPYIAQELLQQFGRQHDLQADTIHNGETFKMLLRDLRPSGKVVVVFERLSSLSDQMLATFANTLRNIFEMRDMHEAYRRFYFILTGGIELYKAVHDGTDSPLAGVSDPIYLDDLTPQESKNLLSWGFQQEMLPAKKILPLCHFIYDQVHGHPYLTQLVADVLIQHLRDGHPLHPRSIAHIPVNIPDVRQMVASMLNKAREYQVYDTLRDIMQQPYYPLLNDKVEKLKVIGLVREEDLLYGKRGRYMIRSKVYAHLLQDAFPASPTSQLSSIPVSGTQTIAPASARLYCALQLTKHDDGSYDVRVAESSTGPSGAATLELPYTPEELRAVFKVLYPPLARKGFTAEQREILQRFKLWSKQSDKPVDDAPKRVGLQLYRTLIVGDVEKVFDNVLNEAINRGVDVALQLRFDRQETEIARYPWELLRHPLYDALALAGRCEVVRYMTYPRNQSLLPTYTAPLRMLYVYSRPKDSQKLSVIERKNVQTLMLDVPQGHVELTQLSRLRPRNATIARVAFPPTYANLDTYLSRHGVDVLHFDGHGSFGRRCPTCFAINLPHFAFCQNRDYHHKEEQSLPDEPSGYLTFEDEHGKKRLIKAEDLGMTIAHYNVRLAVLTSCYSAAVDGESLFLGVTQSLIKQGVRAVVAPQLPVSPEAAAIFVRGFYQSLMVDHPGDLLAAMTNGQRSLLHHGSEEWFVFTLYTNAIAHEPNIFS